LKAKCRERKLKISGNKSVLVYRPLEDGVMPGDEIRDGEGGAEIDMEGGVNGDDGNSDGGGFSGGGRRGCAMIGFNVGG